jgi:hypothetical protein
VAQEKRRLTKTMIQTIVVIGIMRIKMIIMMIMRIKLIRIVMNGGYISGGDNWKFG